MIAPTKWGELSPGDTIILDGLAQLVVAVVPPRVAMLWRDGRSAMRILPAETLVPHVTANYAEAVMGIRTQLEGHVCRG